MIIIAVFIGWWLGNRDKLVLIQENEKIINDFNDQKIELDRKLTDIRLKLKEANLALDTQNIKNSYLQYRSAYGEEYAEKMGIMGALSLYLNFLNMFMFLLQFMGNRD